MEGADRYAALLPTPVRETPRARKFTELELQAHWFAGDFGREFQTLGGEALRVVQFGVWNREAGPDFTDAAVSLNGGEVRRGCIELDPDARDWERHGHAQNPAYESVVLHLFTERGEEEFFTRTLAHRLVPQVLLDANALLNEPPSSLPAAIPGRCLAPLRAMTEEKAREVLLGAAQYRLRQKAAGLARLSETHGADEALYQALAATLGYRSNKLPFTLLAQRLPLKLLRAENAEALLFGVSGFLPAQEFEKLDAPTRSYVRALWESWWPQRAEFERLVIGPELWKLSGQRPANHPQRRLAALAQIVRHWPRIRALRERCEPEAIHECFASLCDEYWDFHYTLSSKIAAKRMALVGESRVVEMLANVFFPLAILDDPSRWAGFKNLRSPLTNRRAEIAALRLFGESPRKAEFLKWTALQQGLLQVYEDFCLRDNTDCERCLFPLQLAKW